MTHVSSGSEQFSDDDRAYAGSRYRDVVAAIFANPYQQVWGREGEPALPNEVVTVRSVFGNLLSRHWNRRFERASERAREQRDRSEQRVARPVRYEPARRQHLVDGGRTDFSEAR